MTHPNSLDLEAFACGEDNRSVLAHVGECSACLAFVERLRGAIAAGPSPRAAADIVARAATRAVESEDGRRAIAQATSKSAGAKPGAPEAARHRWWMKVSTVTIPIAAAAALLLLLTPSTRDVFSPSLPSSPSSPSSPAASLASSPTALGETRTSAAAPASEPETTFKGAVQIAVIRERAGRQARFTGTVPVRPGDRLRVEVALDREQAILAAVMGDDASWLELMTEGARRPGTYFSERSARVDASPMRGTILVGTPEAVARARSTKRFDEVTTIRVEWESP